MKKTKSETLFSKCIDDNKILKDHIFKFIDGDLTSKEFRALKLCRFHKGQWQFGDDSYNITGKFDDGSLARCKHGCRYCYVISIDNHYKFARREADIEEIIPLDEKKIKKRWRKPRNGEKIIFFPSTHDIFVEMMESYVAVVTKIINAGHEIMYVTKPHIDGTLKFIELFPPELKEYIHVWITISTDDNDIIRRFEKHTPLIEERIECIQLLMDAGFNVNIMCEPYLSDPTMFLDKFIPMINGIIAIGPVNYSRNIVMFKDLNENKEMLAYLDSLATNDMTIKIMEYMRDKENIFPKKDLIKNVLRLKIKH